MYNTSLKQKSDNQNVADFTVEQAKQKMLEQERAQALEEKKDIAREMLAAKEPIEKIATYTELSVEEIENL